MKTIKDTTTIEIEGVILNVSFQYSKDSGYLHDSDGHGLPSSEDLDITSIKIGNQECLLLFMDSWVYENIELQILDSLEN
jgi:hypothetical protein